MKTRGLLFLAFALTLFAGATVITVLFNTPPSTTGIFVLFYVSLFLIAGGLLFLVLYFWQFFRFHAIPPWGQTAAVIRWSVLASAVITLALVLQSFRLLNYPTFFVLLAMAIVTEVFMRRSNIKFRNSSPSKNIPI
ncbi:MAG TPA: hypothetical protein VMQ44_00025 [Candidatus Saccharimonadales bacterium]|nr:hypothetical protein [Candidatus Saccharimonadales bacterium]